MLDWTNENKHEAFSEWVDFMSSYFVIHNVEEKLKHNYILISTGPKGREVIKNTQLTTEQKENSKNVFKVFETQMIQKPNKWVERLEFTSFEQNDKTIDEYLVRLQTKADRCEFGTNKDERLLEQIIKGLKCLDERRNLISKPNLTLEIAIENIRAYEATTKNNTRYKDASKMKAGVCHEIEMRRTKPCTRCQRNRGKRKENCYAFNKECKRCHGLHHFENFCLTKMYTRQNSKYSPNKMRHKNRSQSPHNRHRKQTITRRNVNATYKVENEYNKEDDLCLYTINKENGDNREEIFANIDCEDAEKREYKIKMKVDTGANGNIIPYRIYKKMYPRNNYGSIEIPSNVKREITTPWAVNGTKIEQYGSIIMKIKHKNSPTIKAKFFICKNDTAILGLRPSIQLGLVQINCSITTVDTKREIKNIEDLANEYPDRFQGIGSFLGKQKIHIVDNATPVIQPPRKYPVYIREELKRELEKNGRHRCDKEGK